MAEVVSVTLTLSMDEARAVFMALGKMSFNAYGGDEALTGAGQGVYAELTPIVEEYE